MSRSRNERSSGPGANRIKPLQEGYKPSEQPRPRPTEERGYSPSGGGARLPKAPEGGAAQVTPSGGGSSGQSDGNQSSD